MLYYVTKTGLPKFDSCRAYGLALILRQLANKKRVTITNTGNLYLIDGPEMDDFIANPSFDSSLFALSDGWCSTLLTTGRTPKAERLKPKSKDNIQKEIVSVQEVIYEFKIWLKQFQHPSVIEIKSSISKGFSSLPASVDAVASKGTRREKRRGYSEGEQLFVPIIDWALSLFGHAHFVRSAWAGGDYASLLPIPQFVKLNDHRNLKATLDTQFLCTLSATTVAAHYAIQWINGVRKQKSSQSIYSDRYDSLVVQTMTYSGNNWKPSNGTIFPLDYPIQLVEDNLAISAEIFDVWNHVFRWGSVKGNEMLALTLAKFLSQPTLTTFEEHAKVHLRMSITDDKRRKYGVYQEEWLKEILQYVKQ